MKVKSLILFILVMGFISCNKYSINDGTYDAIFIGGTDTVNYDNNYAYKTTAIEGSLKLIDLGNRTKRAILTTDFKFLGEKWVEEGSFDGKGNFIVSTTDPVTFDEKVDTCRYEVKKDFIIIQDKKSILRLTPLNKTIQKDHPDYTTIYIFKK